MKRSIWLFPGATVVVVALVACSSSSDGGGTAATDASTADTSTADTSIADTSIADTSVADTSIEDAGPTAFGCDLVFDGGGHTCSDYVYTNIPAGLFTTAKTQCGALKGTVLASCDRATAVGGCTATEMKNGITTVTTTWQYTGTPSSIMALCATQPGYTYIAP